MDPERVPPLPQQSEITSPVHALDTDTTTGTIQPNPPIPSHSYAPRRTARIDSSNLSPFAGNGSTTESPSSEKLEVSEILSLQQNINAYIFCAAYTIIFTCSTSRIKLWKKGNWNKQRAVFKHYGADS